MIAFADLDESNLDEAKPLARSPSSIRRRLQVNRRISLAATAIQLILLAASSGAAQSAAADARGFHVFNVKDFGAMGDGQTLDTAAISKTVRAASGAGGGRVLFPPGIYVTGTFELLSNVALDVQAGAVIQGSKNLADYGTIAEYGFGRQYGVNSTGEGDRVGLVVARRAENIAIVGQGAIDGSGNAFFDFTKPHIGMDFDPRYTRQGNAFMKSMLDLADGPVETKPAGRPGTMIVCSQCQNILIRDITLRNAPNWTLHLAGSARATINGIHIVNNPLLPNNDGIDCIGCKDVHISDCDISAGDDAFAFYGSEDVSVTNCSLYSRSSAIRVENTRYGKFSNLSVHSNRGIGIYSRGGITANLVFTDITVETQLYAGHWWGKAEPIFIAIGPAGEGSGPGTIKDVRFSNIVGEAEAGIILAGDATSSIRNLYLDQIKLRIRAPRKTVGEEAGGNFDFRWTAASPATAIFKHDIAALYCRNVEGLNLRGFQLEWANEIPEYFSNAIECEDFKNLEIEAFAGRQASASSADPVIALRRGQGVSIRGCRAEEGSSTFVSLSDVEKQGFFANNDLRNSQRPFASKKVGFLMVDNLLP